MSIPPIGERTHGSMAILAIGCLLLACCLAGCSGQPQASSSETGSFTCSLAWPEEVPTLEEGAARVAGGIDCAAEGIDTVAFAFYDATGSYLTGDEWPCFLGEGTVDGIPAGSNRRLVVTGEDASGTVIYRGEKTGITIIANQVTQGGEIDMLPVSTSYNQVYDTNADFPSDWIDEKWDEGYDITSMAYGDGMWAVVMSE
jgi:hypothetical protein